MVPQGLVLLTTIAFAVSVVVLGRRKVLVQELPAVEVLARVDVVCLDKTGTLTEAALALDRVEALDEGSPVADVLGALGAIGRNSTAEAIAERYPVPSGWTAEGGVPFSSARKWSGGVVRRARHVGAGRAGDPAGRRARTASCARESPRWRPPAAASCCSRAPPSRTRRRASREIQPAALVLLDERVRPDAAETLRLLPRAGRGRQGHLRRQPRHRRGGRGAVGLDASEPVDARDLPDDEPALAALMREQHRVRTRHARRTSGAMVEALQRATATWWR